MKMNKPRKATVKQVTHTLLGAGIAMLCFTQAQAQTTSQRDRVINIQAQASQQVANDEMHATLYIEKQNTKSDALANEINTVINTALAHAKQYAQVKAATGSQSTYPMYYKNGKIRGWQGRAEIALRSQNFEQTGRLIAQLQQDMTLGNVSFRVSQEKRESVETELMTQASKRFQTRAQSLLNVWNATSYKLVHLDLNTSGNYHTPVYSMRSQMESKSIGAVTPQNYSGGETNITVTAQGRIQLQ